MIRRFVLFALLCSTAACSQAPARIAAPPAPVIVNSADSCLAQLQQMHVGFEVVAPFGDPESGCGIDNPVKVSATDGDWSRPALLSCDLARTFARFEKNVLQPAALTQFGLPVTRILHAGTYNCRSRRNATQVAANLTGSKGGRLSEHAKGRAIDITGFELMDGTTINVKRDWRGQGAKSTFLQTVARESCSSFKVVLTPNHDSLHQDHLHLDVGPYTLCGF